VKLFDFGIAKAANRITQTQFGMVKGNVRFMSPEQARGDQVDSRSDLFAVGLVIHYALSGDALYAADTAYNLLVKAAQGPGEKELANLRSLPPQAQRILERALQIRPEDRFQTAAEFAQALAPFIAGAHDARARSPDAVDHRHAGVASRSRRRRAGNGAGAAAGALSGGRQRDRRPGIRAPWADGVLRLQRGRAGRVHDHRDLAELRRGVGP